MNLRTLDIAFFPVVTFAVSCQPGAIEPTDDAYTIENEDKWEEILAGPGQRAGVEDGKSPHSDRGTWETVGPLQNAEGPSPNA
jgi:hypothetical protein